MNIFLIKSLIQKYSRDVSLIVSSQIIGSAVNLVTLPIILSRLSINDFGSFQLVLAIQSWLILFTAGNITIGAKKGIANNKEGTFLFAFLYRSRFFIAITAISILISAIFLFFNKETIGILSLIVSGYTLFGYLPQVSYAEYLIGKKDFKSFFIWQTISSVSISMASLASVLITNNILIFVAIQIGLTIITNILALIYIIIKHNLYTAYKNKEIDEDCKKYGLKLIPTEILLGTSNQLSNFIIGPFFGLSNLAIFSIASKIDAAFRGVLRISYNLLYSDFAKEKYEDLLETIKKQFGIIVVFSLIATFICLIIAIFYIKAFLPKEYSSVALYVIIFITAFPAFIIQSLLRTATDSDLRHKEVGLFTFITCFFKIGSILVLGYFFKIIGIIVALTMTTWLEFILYYLATLNKKFFNNTLNRHPFILKIVDKF